MKVAILNMSDKLGGAAIAANRTASSLEKYYNVDCIYLVRSKSGKSDNVFQTTSNTFRTVERYFNIFMNAIGLQYFFLPFSPRFIKQKLKDEKPDIIQLHNIIGGYFQIHDLIELNKLSPIVWTLHDMWAITANGAHTFGDNSFIQLQSAKKENKIYPHIGLNTGNWLIKRKKEIYNKTNRLTIVVPSLWLMNLVKQSPALKNKELTYIPHGINLQKFHSMNKKDIRSKYSIPENAKVIMFAAQSSLFKGGYDLINILTEINNRLDFELHVLLLGGLMDELNAFSKIKVHHLGYIREEEKMIEAYSATDLFLYPTRADNLPLVLIESIACGRPVVTFNVGGCPEIIKDNYNGFVIENFNYIEAATKTLQLLTTPNLLENFSLNARKFAEENFDEKKMAESYFHLYSKLAKESGPTSA